jgi:acyl carrier protein
MPMWSTEFEAILRPHCRFVAPAEEIDADAPLRGLGVGSIDMLTMLVEIEDGLGVALPDAVLTGEEFGTPRLLWRVICELAAARSDAVNG